MKAPFKKTIQQKFDDIKLPEDKLDALIKIQENTLDLQQDAPPIRKWKKSRLISMRLMSVAAMLLLTVGLFLVNPFQQDMAYKIANEVTHNHFKLKPLEVQSSVLSDIKNYFTKLDFKPISSELISTKSLTLLGARYCSLQGITAAQIRYQSENGDLTTFYEVPYDEAIYSKLPNIENGEEPLVSYSKGVGVKIWVEKGILMAMTL